MNQPYPNIPTGDFSNSVFIYYILHCYLFLPTYLLFNQSLYVGDLAQDVNDQILYDLFNRIGQVISVAAIVCCLCTQKAGS